MEELEPIMVRRNGRSLYYRIPAWWHRANHLKVGDMLVIPLKNVRIIRAENVEKEFALETTE
jgi:hypothetical protein